MGTYTDFKPIVGGSFPFPYYIHICPECGYTGTKDDFEEDVEPELRNKILKYLSPLIEDKVPEGAEKYEYAAWCAQWRGAGPTDIADLYLKAAWCSQEEKDPEGERAYRERALEFFKIALELGVVSKKERAMITYLIGELYRRIGKRGEADLWFERVPVEMVNEEEQRWILKAAEQQKNNPRESFEK